jgi:hypothetical protein
MGKAFRSDSLGSSVIAAEITALEQRVDAIPPEIVRCPADGCTVTYSLYNYVLSDRDGNRELLLYRLRREHPNHTVYFVLNEPG